MIQAVALRLLVYTLVGWVLWSLFFPGWGTPSSRSAANESAAGATLRSISAAQEQFRESCAIDTDGDGEGEFGFFGELAGSDPLRILDEETGFPTRGDAGDRLDPPYLAAAFADVRADERGDGVVERQGYLFKIYLRGPDDERGLVARTEHPEGGARSDDLGARWSPTHAETHWCAYAWPIDYGRTGRRVFFIDQAGDLLRFDNECKAFVGLCRPPSVNAVWQRHVWSPIEK